MYKKKRFWSVLITLVMCITFVAGCGNGETTESETAQTGQTDTVAETTAGSEQVDVFRVGVATLETTMDPCFKIGNANMQVMYNVYETLLVEDDTSEDGVGPGLAESYEQVDEVTWDLKLREGVTFHNGEDFTADDVVYTFERLADDTYASANIALRYTTVIDSVEAVDDYTVRFHLKNEDLIFLKRLTSQRGAYIVPKDYIEENGNEYFQTHPIGTGPYKVTTFEPEKIVIEAYDGYWGEQPNARSIEYIRYKETATRMTALVNGEVDMIAQVTPDMIPTIEGYEGFKIEGGVVDTIYVIAYTGDEAPMSDVNFRLALSYGIDRQLLVDKLWSGKTEVADKGMQFEYYGDYYVDDFEAISYDPEKAREYLEKSSYNGEEITLTCTDNYYTYGNETCEAIVDMWQEIGINAKIDIQETFDWKTMGSMRTWSTASSIADLAGDLVTLYGPGSQSAKNCFTNGFPEGWIELCESLQTETDPDKRYQICEEILTRWEYEGLGTCLYFNADYVAVRDGVNYETNSHQTFNFRAEGLSFE